MFFNSEAELDPVGWWLQNSGPGPAVVTKVELQYRDKKYDSLTWDHWHEILNALKIPWNAVTGWDVAIGDGIKGNESMPLLVFRNEEYLKKQFPELDVNAAAGRLARSLRIKIKYKSVHDEKFESESPAPWGPKE